MKAVVYTEYGSPDVLHLQMVEKPTPRDNQLLIRVRAASVNIGDLMARRFNSIAPHEFSMPSPLWLVSRLVFGLRRPSKTILGSEFAGEVEAVGSAVTGFRPGDAVFGYCGMSFGTNAEYLCIAESGLVAHKPAAMTFEQAAAVPYGALTAYSLLKKAAIQPGDRVLINGASGAIGSFAVQIATHLGAQVTGVCSTAGVAMVHKLGADHVIDYTKQDFTCDTAQYDLVLDVLNKSSFGRVRQVLTPHGRYQLVSFKLPQLAQMLWTSLRGGQRVVCALSDETPDDLRAISAMVDAGTLTAVIDRCFPLEQAAEAHRYMENGNRKGGVVLTLNTPS